MIKRLIIKLKIAYLIAFKTNGTFLKVCGICRGLHFDVIEVTSNNEIYNAKYKCRKCEAIGTIHEEWKLEVK